MTKKDYELIASVLKRAVEAERRDGVSMLWICQIMAHELKKKNEKFNGLFFSWACGFDYNITL